jgi:hypothetical protein
MQSFLVVIAVDEHCDVKAKIFQVLVLSCINLFPLERSEEAFAVGIVARADARDYAVLVQHPQISGMGVLRRDLSEAPSRVLAFAPK